MVRSFRWTHVTIAACGCPLPPVTWFRGVYSQNAAGTWQKV